MEESQAILPLMTALFVDSFESSGAAIGSGTQRRHPGYEKRIGRIFRLPLNHEDSESSPLYVCLSQRMFKQGIGTQACSTQGSTQVTLAIRTLISGISRNYNNLFMGILGNATLIRLQLKDTEADFERAVGMERLIQSGSFLIHMVLGYLSERLVEAKRMRLQQLFKEMKAEVPGSLNESDFWKLEERLQWASRSQNPRLIASSSARVLEVLFQEIQFFCQELASSKAGHRCIMDKLDAIEILAARGLELTQLLRWYAGDFKPNMNRVQLRPLVNRKIIQLSANQANIKVNIEVKRQLPTIWADRQLIEFAFQQILINAIQTQPSDSELTIALRRFQEEAPEERCGVHMRSDYVVITIQDSGPGISPEIQKRIFEPFFRIPGKSGHADLGLAAAAGIIRAHRGYIQVQSILGKGSLFKIYLPLPSAVGEITSIRKRVCVNETP